MPATPFYPALYQVNTRVWLTELSRQLGRPATLDDVPDGALDRFAQRGFDWVWLLGVWQTGAAGREVSRGHAEWRREFHQKLPDLQEDDIPGSCFAITAYTVHTSLGGNAALVRLRRRLQQRNLKLMLDFVPNHTALDHPWTQTHPDYYVQGNEEDLARSPHNWCRVTTQGAVRVFAHGRDPYFPGWPDTLQLNYAQPAFQEAMLGELLQVAGLCDGVRCDMAMLVLPEIFERTWARRSAPFWPRAIERIRAQFPQFLFMAEVYWDLEWALQQQGFDYAYDKRLYDRLREGHARFVREHLLAGLDYQNRLARFLENHDEPRAAATFPSGVHQAAAVVTYLAPGLRFLHQGQFEGRAKRISPHLGRGPDEPTDRNLQQFYDQLLSVLKSPVVRQGRWRLLECAPAWPGNWSSENFIAFAWESETEQRFWIVVNFGPYPGQCYMRLPFPSLAGRTVRLRDLLSPACYDRAGDDLLSGGLYLDMVPWHYHVFQVMA